MSLSSFANFYGATRRGRCDRSEVSTLDFVTQVGSTCALSPRARLRSGLCFETVAPRFRSSTLSNCGEYRDLRRRRPKLRRLIVFQCRRYILAPAATHHEGRHGLQEHVEVTD